MNDASDSKESVNDTWLAAWDIIPPTLPTESTGLSGHTHPRRHPRRAKPNRLVVYLPDDLYEIVLQLMTSCGFARAGVPRDLPSRHSGGSK